MNQISERDQKTLRFGGIAVGVILAFILVGFPLMDYWDRLNRDVAAAEQKIRSVEAGLNDAAAAGSAMREVSERATIFTDRAALNQQTALMRQQVESVSGYTALNVVRVEDLPLREGDDYFRSAVSMQFSGTLQDVHHFLRGLETASPVLKVERLTVATDAENPARVQGQMVIAGYAVVLSAGGKKG